MVLDQLELYSDGGWTNNIYHIKAPPSLFNSAILLFYVCLSLMLMILEDLNAELP